MSVAERIAARVEALRPKYEDVALPDQCYVLRPVRTADGRGGHTDVDQVVEACACALSASMRDGTEGVASDRLVGVTVYTCDLPYSTLLTDKDTLRVNGRDFTVVSVAWEEGFAIGKTALLEART